MWNMITKLGWLLVVGGHTWTWNSLSHHFGLPVVMGIDVLAVLPMGLLTQNLLGNIFGKEAIDRKWPILILFRTRPHGLEGTHHFVCKFVRHGVGAPRIYVLSV
jgi:hypothetical protein